VRPRQTMHRRRQLQRRNSTPTGIVPNPAPADPPIVKPESLQVMATTTAGYNLTIPPMRRPRPINPPLFLQRRSGVAGWALAGEAGLDAFIGSLTDCCTYSTTKNEAIGDQTRTTTFDGSRPFHHIFRNSGPTSTLRSGSFDGRMAIPSSDVLLTILCFQRYVGVVYFSCRFCRQALGVGSVGDAPPPRTHRPTIGRAELRSRPNSSPILALDSPDSSGPTAGLRLLTPPFS